MSGDEIRMNEAQLSSGENRMIKAFLTYNEKQLKRLEENNGDIELINKIKSNIDQYKKQLNHD
jgi:hypothetical protein